MQLLPPALAKPTKVDVGGGFDGGPEGGYVPQMSQADARRWKAKSFNLGKENARVELRKAFNYTQVTIFVAMDGWDYAAKYEHRRERQLGEYMFTDTRGLNVRMSMNGSLLLTFEQFAEINQIVQEAKEYLEYHKKKRMKIGITGTRNGMTDFQLDAVQDWLAAWPEPRGELHHGDCVGADAEVAAIAHHLLAYRTVCHPPIKSDLRAFFESDETREPLSYFARNRNIVDQTQILMVVPGQPKQAFLTSCTGGTLYTYNYAKKQNKPRVIFYPNGEVVCENPNS